MQWVTQEELEVRRLFTLPRKVSRRVIRLDQKNHSNVEESLGKPFTETSPLNHLEPSERPPIAGCTSPVGPEELTETNEVPPQLGKTRPVKTGGSIRKRRKAARVDPLQYSLS